MNEDEMRSILLKIFKYNSDNIESNELINIFKRKIFRTIKQLEKDLGKLS
jgi:hypothetical protein